MAERRWEPTVSEIEAALLDLGQHLDYPPTPDLARAVRRRLTSPLDSLATLDETETIDGRHSRRSPFRLLRFEWERSRWVGLVAALALCVLAAALVAAASGAVTAVAERLGVRGVTIVHVATVPTASPLPTPPPVPTPLCEGASPTIPVLTIPRGGTGECASTVTPTPVTPTPVGEKLRLGERLDLAEARRRVAFAILLPTLPELGVPDEIYLATPPRGSQVALVYRARPGVLRASATGVALLLTELQGDLEPNFLGKGIGPGTRLQEVTVNGRPGYWLEGAPHVFFYRDPAGEVVQETLRLAGNTLLWEENGLTLRLEGDLTRDEALRIAGSLR